MDYFVEILMCALFAGVGVCGLGLLAIPADLRVLRRVFRTCRFGLRTAFALMATLAVTFGFASVLGVDFRDPAIICVLMVGAPLAVFIVGLAGLVLAEIFDTKSTRAIVARRSVEDELTAYNRERAADAKRASEERRIDSGIRIQTNVPADA